MMNLLAERLMLAPAMPVEAFLQTGGGTAISFLLKPVSDQSRQTGVSVNRIA
jgi:hypothetical protein